MSRPPSFKEELILQISALRLLIVMVYQYLTPEEALALRGGKKNHVILEDVLEPWLRAHNQVTLKWQTVLCIEATDNCERAARAGFVFGVANWERSQAYLFPTTASDVS